MDNLDRLITVEELAAYLGVPVATLYQWRYRREGPPSFRVGRHVRYRWGDVQEWIEDQMKASWAHSSSHRTSTVGGRGR